jgi:hypothetical protein
VNDPGHSTGSDCCPASRHSTVERMSGREIFCTEEVPGPRWPRRRIRRYPTERRRPSSSRSAWKSGNSPTGMLLMRMYALRQFPKRGMAKLRGPAAVFVIKLQKQRTNALVAASPLPVKPILSPRLSGGGDLSDTEGAAKPSFSTRPTAGSLLIVSATRLQVDAMDSHRHGRCMTEGHRPIQGGVPTPRWSK